MPYDSFALSSSRPLRYASFFYLYLMQGVPSGFALTAVANYLLAEGASAARVGSFVALVGLPWAVQFVWGPLVDRFQHSGMGRRKPWVVLSQFMAFIASLGLLTIDDPVSQLGALTFAFFIHSIFASIQDASVDALAIGITPESERGRVNAFMRGGMLTGVGLGAAVLSYLIRSQGFFAAALAQSALLLLFTVVTFLIKERPGDALLPGKRVPSRARESAQGGTDATLRNLFAELFAALAAPRSLRFFGAIALVYLCQSFFFRAFSAHLIGRLGWADTSLSLFSGTYGTAVALAVILTGGVIADRIGARKLLLLVMVFLGSFLVIFNLLAPWWGHTPVATGGLTVWYMADPVFSVAAMPLLMTICRKGVEGSQFTTYMALVNLTEIAGAYLSGQAFRWLTAPAIGLISGGLMLAAAGLTLLSFRRERRELTAAMYRPALAERAGEG
jgi:PAT family beta-lactamase induction signal transducer AmpG